MHHACRRANKFAGFRIAYFIADRKASAPFQHQIELIGTFVSVRFLILPWLQAV
jgi:hypothetical protein